MKNTFYSVFQLYVYQAKIWEFDDQFMDFKRTKLWELDDRFMDFKRKQNQKSKQAAFCAALVNL